MKTIFERYETFKKRNNLTFEEITKLAKEYANSPQDNARTFFTERYTISPHVFYKCLEFAIICHLVDENTRRNIRAKAISNYKLHNEVESRKKAMDHHAFLARERQTFFNEIPNKIIIDISVKYSEGANIAELSTLYEMCETTIKKLMAKGIVEVITPSSVVFLMKKRVKKEGKSVEAFQRLEQKRRDVRNRAVKPFEDEIRLLKFQLKHYNEYFDGDQFYLEKGWLENRLKEVIKKYEDWLDF